jgi:hypothetical protein
MMRKGAIALFLALLAAYFLNHGIFIGSDTWVREGFRYKTCRYLFITGVAGIQAPGGFIPGTELAVTAPTGLHCRFFGD